MTQSESTDESRTVSGSRHISHSRFAMQVKLSSVYFLSDTLSSSPAVIKRVREFLKHENAANTCEFMRPGSILSLIAEIADLGKVSALL